MSAERIIISLPVRLIEELDKRADQLGLSRTAYIRMKLLELVSLEVSQ